MFSDDEQLGKTRRTTKMDPGSNGGVQFDKYALKINERSNSVGVECCHGSERQVSH